MEPNTEHSSGGGSARKDGLFALYLLLLVWLPVPYASITQATRLFATLLIFVLLAWWLSQYLRGWRELPAVGPVAGVDCRATGAAGVDRGVVAATFGPAPGRLAAR